MVDLLKKDKQYVWHPFTQHQTAGDPLQVVRAEGTLLFDIEGKSYIDANSSWWVNVHGHGHPHLAEAVNKQFMELEHVVFAGVTHPKAVELSERITKVLPENFQRVFFSDNGSTSTEVALKMSFQYWFNKDEDRKRVLAIEGAYHGDTFGAMSVGERDMFNRPFEPFFFDVDYLPFPESDKEAEILTKAEKLLSTKTFASLILEPLVQGASGMRMYSSNFLDQLSAIAKKYETIVIFDEVMTGFGRTGKMFAMDHCEVKPDIVCLSKGLTGGTMALGLTVASEKMYQSFLSDEMARGFLHGHSFTANPLASAVSCANLDLFEKPSTKEAINTIVNWNQTFADELKQWQSVENVRQQGTILAFSVKNEAGNTYFSSIRDRAYKFFLNNGVLLRPLGNTIFINPPYCITEEEYIELKSVILGFLRSLEE
ncbi:MAG: adenosylmethionine--8-amino-7-oxononanoate transaminase [Crocinitomicaceae bacterium]